MIHALAESSNFDWGLFLCSNGTPGSLFVILPAMVGRLCLDICFTTIYLGLVEDFSESAQMTVLPACNLAFEIFCACKLTHRLQDSVSVMTRFAPPLFWRASQNLQPLQHFVRSTSVDANLLGLKSWYLQDSRTVQVIAEWNYYVHIQISALPSSCFFEVVFSESFIIPDDICSVIT